MIVSMDADDVVFTTVLTEAHVLFIPPWQRKVRLGDRAVDKDVGVARACQDRSVARDFLGAIVVQEAGKEGPVLQRRRVIDGQQRLVTLSLFVSALQQRAASLGMGDLPAELFRLLWENKSDGLLRLTPWGKDEGAYRLCIEGKGLPYESLGEASTFFAEKLERYSKTQISALWNAVSSRLFFAYVLLDKGNNTYQIFQSLNDTGKLLTPTDLIRNHLFPFPPAPRERIFFENSGNHGNWLGAPTSKLERFLLAEAALRRHRGYGTKKEALRSVRRTLR